MLITFRYNQLNPLMPTDPYIVHLTKLLLLAPFLMFFNDFVIYSLKEDKTLF